MQDDSSIACMKLPRCTVVTCSCRSQSRESAAHRSAVKEHSQLCSSAAVRLKIDTPVGKVLVLLQVDDVCHALCQLHTVLDTPEHGRSFS